MKQKRWAEDAELAESLDGKLSFGAANVFKMSLPIFAELLLQLFVGNVDQIMISQYSQNSVAAIGNGNQIMNIVIIFLNVMSAATTILLTQYIGAGNKDKISETCSVSMMLILGVGLFATGALTFFNRQIFSLMRVPTEVMDEACLYMRIIGSFVFVQGVYLNFAAIIRSFSMMKEVMFASVAMNGINIIGNAILLNGFFGLPQMGIAGVAISTNFSKAVGLGLLLLVFLKKIDAKLTLRHLKPFPWETVKRILNVALPSGGEGLSYNLSQMVILGMINTFGTTVIATKIYASMLANVSYVYAIAIARATQIVLGYLIGAGRKEEVSRRVWQTLRISMVTCLSAILVVYFNSDRIFGIFTNQPEILQLGKQVFLIEIFLEIGRAINIVMVNSLIAAGDIKAPIIVGVISQWLIAALFAYFLGVHFGLGLVGIWIAMAMDECIRGIIFVARFNHGAWKEKSLI